mgnify:FL=1|jgi:hypothetical protein
MGRRFGLEKSVTPWHAYVIASAAYVSAQPLVHNPDVPMVRGVGYLVAALVGFYLVVRVAMAVMSVVEELTSLWPNRFLSVKVYCLGFATAETMQAIQAYGEVTSESFLVWSSEPATGTAIFGLLVVGIPLTAGLGLANWVRLKFLQPREADIDY